MDRSARADAQARLDAYVARHGAAAFQQAVSGGQYTHPDGIFYGGRAPSWSRRTLLAIAASHLAKARHVGVIDYHTGLGPCGHGERIVIHRQGSAALARARDWYGADITSTSLGTSASSDVVGDALTGLEHALGHAEVTGMALEYGVRPLKETLDALRADNWLHAHGQLDSAEGRAIKAAMREVFYGDADDWKDMVFAQAMDAQGGAGAGVARVASGCAATARARTAQKEARPPSPSPPPSPARGEGVHRAPSPLAGEGGARCAATGR